MKKTVFRGRTSCGLACSVLGRGGGQGPREARERQRALGLVLQRPEDWSGSWGFLYDGGLEHVCFRHQEFG